MKRIALALLFMAMWPPAVAAEEVVPLVPGRQGVTYPQLLKSPLPIYPQDPRLCISLELFRRRP